MTKKLNEKCQKGKKKEGKREGNAKGKKNALNEKKMQKILLMRK